MARVIPPRVEGLKTAKEVASEFRMSYQRLLNLLSFFKFRKIFGEYKLDQIDIEKIKYILKFK